MPTSLVGLDNWLRESLFDSMPMAVAVIDRDFNLVRANRAFSDMFGPWESRKCYAVYKGRDTLCPMCKGSAAFDDGRARVNEEEGYNRLGQLTRYIKHTLPVRDESGQVAFLVEISTDITETERIRQEHQLLFDQVPCNIAILDRDLKVVKANRRVRESFGEVEGRHCFEAFKHLDKECFECPARRTFADGKLHTAHSVVRSLIGQKVDLLVTTVPLGLATDNFDYVMEMGVDITQTLRLEDELTIAYTMMETMIATSIDGIIAVDEERVTIFNPAARNLFNVPDGRTVTRSELYAMFPEGFPDWVAKAPAYVYHPDVTVTTLDGEQVSVRLVGMRLEIGDRLLGLAFSVQDLRKVKQLEKEKLDAERLAAVGQTVAGLAHGVKNLITGLEGGMYMLTSGLKNGKADRLAQGLDMLTRNVERIALFVKEFLSFSKGRQIRVKPGDPAAVASEVVEMYATRARELGISLTHEADAGVKPANLDYEGMHECLTNLVGNAIDACRMSDKPQCGVTVKTFEQDGAIVYEVTDDGTGMDYEVKKKVFTNFFTTKGSGGTGLGLLMTKKIITEHGGRVELESEPGQGTTFRIILPRERLPEPANPSE